MKLENFNNNTDKIRYHGYHRFYNFFLERLPEEFTMLEIGVEHGHSRELWKEAFPKAKVHGIDINVEAKDGRGQVFKGDQSDTKFLRKVIKKIGSPKFIIDDGSHVPEHQVLTFIDLFPSLQEGGIYIIEDIETNYWVKGKLYGYTIEKGFKHPDSVIEIFKALADRVNESFIGDNVVLSPIPVATQKMIQTITFAQNCIIITKKTKEDEKYTHPTYIYNKYVDVKRQ